MTRNFRLIFILFMLMSVSTSLSAQTGRLGFFINAAGFFPQQKNIHEGYGSGIGVVLHIKPKISVSLEWKYSRFLVDEEEGKFFDGTLTVTPLVASIQYSLSASESFFPYVFAGGGLYFNSFRLNGQVDLQEVNIRKQEIKTGLGFYGGIGTAVRLKENLFLSIEGLYLGRASEVETIFLDNSPAASFTVNLSSFSILIGIKYRY